jgi:hypothetical protein
LQKFLKRWLETKWPDAVISALALSSELKYDGPLLTQFREGYTLPIAVVTRGYPARSGDGAPGMKKHGRNTGPAI